MGPRAADDQNLSHPRPWALFDEQTHVHPVGRPFQSRAYPYLTEALRAVERPQAGLPDANLRKVDGDSWHNTEALREAARVDR